MIPQPYVCTLSILWGLFGAVRKLSSTRWTGLVNSLGARQQSPGMLVNRLSAGPALGRQAGRRPILWEEGGL